MVRGQLTGISIFGGNSAIGVAGEVISATNQAIEIFGQNNTINVLTGGEVFGETQAILVNGNGGNMITVAGTVTSRTEDAIFLQGGSNVVTIADTGTVIGQTLAYFSTPEAPAPIRSSTMAGCKALATQSDPSKTEPS